MNKSLLLLPLAVALAAPAQAGPPRHADLSVSLDVPAGLAPYSVGTTQITVRNNGPRRANYTEVTIELPETNTSPGVHFMGHVVDLDSRCSLSGTTITCDVGHLRKNRSTTVWFDAEFAHSTAALTITASASSQLADPVSSNDSDSDEAVLAYPSVTVAAGDQGYVDHCTGTGLTSFLACELHPSSISSHEIEFQSGGTLIFTNPGGTSFHGYWSQSPNGSHLSMEYYDGQSLQATFVGRAVNGSCFEGITTFPNSSFNSAYSVCL